MKSDLTAKSKHYSVISLPRRTLHHLKIPFTIQEKKFYERLEDYSKTTIGKSRKLTEAGKGNQNAIMLVVLLRLRQACDAISIINQSEKGTGAVDMPTAESGAEVNVDEEGTLVSLYAVEDRLNLTDSERNNVIG